MAKAPASSTGAATSEQQPWTFSAGVGCIRRTSTVPSALVWASLVYAGAVSSVLATVALFWLVQRRAAGRFAPYLLSTPLVSSALGVAFFGDVITIRLLVGAAATLGGVAIVALAERRGVAPAQA